MRAQWTDPFTRPSLPEEELQSVRGSWVMGQAEPGTERPSLPPGAWFPLQQRDPYRLPAQGQLGRQRSGWFWTWPPWPDSRAALDARLRSQCTQLPQED